MMVRLLMVFLWVILPASAIVAQPTTTSPKQSTTPTEPSSSAIPSGNTISDEGGSLKIVPKQAVSAGTTVGSETRTLPRDSTTMSPGARQNARVAPNQKNVPTSPGSNSNQQRTPPANMPVNPNPAMAAPGNQSQNKPGSQQQPSPEAQRDMQRLMDEQVKNMPPEIRQQIEQEQRNQSPSMYSSPTNKMNTR